MLEYPFFVFFGFERDLFSFFGLSIMVILGSIVVVDSLVVQVLVRLPLPINTVMRIMKTVFA